MRCLLLFYVLSAWLQVGGHHAPGGWVIPCTGADPLDLANVSVQEAYAILLRNKGTENRCVEKFSALGVEWHTVWKNLEQLRHDRACFQQRTVYFSLVCRCLLGATVVVESHLSTFS